MNPVTVIALQQERAYQQATAHKWNHKGLPSLGDEILMLSAYVEQARAAWLGSPANGSVLDILRKAGGIICRSMDNRVEDVVLRDSSMTTQSKAPAT